MIYNNLQINTIDFESKYSYIDNFINNLFMT